MPKYIVHAKDRDNGRVLSPSVVEASDGAQAAEQVARPELLVTLVEAYAPTMGPAWTETLAVHEEELARRQRKAVRARSRQQRKAVFTWATTPLRACYQWVVSSAKRHPLASLVLLVLTVGLAAWWVVLQSRPPAALPKSHLATISDVPNALELAWSPDGERLACVNPGWRRFFDIPTANLASRRVPPADLFPVMVWNSATGSLVTTLPDTERVGIVLWNSASTQLVTVEPKRTPKEPDRTPKAWDVATGQEQAVTTYVERKVVIRTLRKVGGEWQVISPDGQLVAHAPPSEIQFEARKAEREGIQLSDPTSEATYVKVFALQMTDLAAGPSLLLKQFASPLSAAWSPDSQRLAVVAFSRVSEWEDWSVNKTDAEVWICDPRSGQSVVQCEGKVAERNPLTSGYHAAQVAWSADGKQVMVQADASYFAWDATTGERLLEQTFDQDPACADSATKVYWSPDGRRVAVHTKDGRVNLWGPPLWARAHIVLGAALVGLLAFASLCVWTRVPGRQPVSRSNVTPEAREQ